MSLSSCREDGGVSAELAVLTPMLVLGMLFVVFAGRLGQAELDVAQAAAEAARAASLAREGDVAAVAAATARADMAATGTRCVDLGIETTVARHEPVGTVTVGITCVVDRRGLDGLGLSSDQVVATQATEVIDVYRGTRR